MGSRHSPRSPRFVGKVMQPVDEIAPCITPALSHRSGEDPQTDAPDNRGEAQAFPPGEYDHMHPPPGVGNNSREVEVALTHTYSSNAEQKPRRIRGGGVVSTRKLGLDSFCAYPKFLLPERGYYMSPRSNSRVSRSDHEMYGKYTDDLHSGIASTQRQLAEIDGRWKDAIRTDQMKLQLMKARAGEVNSYLQKQISEKKARSEAEREARLAAIDPYARTGYPPCPLPYPSARPHPRHLLTGV